MLDLQECRNQIDQIDDEMIRLFEKRMKVCEEVARYKIHTGKKVLDPKREQDKLKVLREKAHGEFNALGAQELFQQQLIAVGNAQHSLHSFQELFCQQAAPLIDLFPANDR